MSTYVNVMTIQTFDMEGKMHVTFYNKGLSQ